MESPTGTQTLKEAKNSRRSWHFGLKHPPYKRLFYSGFSWVFDPLPWFVLLLLIESSCVSGHLRTYLCISMGYSLAISVIFLLPLKGGPRCPFGPRAQTKGPPRERGFWQVFDDFAAEMGLKPLEKRRIEKADEKSKKQTANPKQEQ